MLRRTVRTVIVGALLAVACGGSDAEPSAVVEVLDATVERGAEESFVVAATGDELTVGDVVRTDVDGFGQIDYADGSLARLGPSTSLAVVDLSASAEEISVELELDEGRVWNRVAPDGGTASYEIATVVGTAAVPGTSNLWLAGMPEGTQLQGDTVPDQAPVLVEGLDLQGGQVLWFAATGSVSYGGGTPSAAPDGELRGSHDAANGIGASTVGWNALVGVFLDDQQPDEAGPAPAALDFSSMDARDAAAIQPALRQPFFIGDGVRADGSPHDVVVPDGATRLYLGTVDGFGWFNNTGAFEVTVAVVDLS